MDEDNIIYDSDEQDKLDDEFSDHEAQEKDIKDEKAGAIVSGSKLGVLVASLPINNEEKTSLMELIESASIDQLQRLESGLEELYLDYQTLGVDEDFKEGLEALKSEIESKEDELEDDFLIRFKNIENRVNAY